MSTHTTPGSTHDTGRHPVNVAHLVMGLAFLCFAAGWALVQGDVVTGKDVRWLLPIPWLVAGAAGLAALTVTNLRKHGPDASNGATGTDHHPDHTTEILEQP
jgi:hypothetical protein